MTTRVKLNMGAIYGAAIVVAFAAGFGGGFGANNHYKVVKVPGPPAKTRLLSPAEYAAALGTPSTTAAQLKCPLPNGGYWKAANVLLCYG